MRIDDDNTLLCLEKSPAKHFHHLEKDKEVLILKGQEYNRRILIKYNVLNDGRTIQFIFQVHAKEDVESKNSGNHYWISEEFNMFELFNTKEPKVLDYEQ